MSTKPGVDPVRLVALDALVRVEDGAFANLVLPAMLRAGALDARDRSMVTDLVYGTVRWRRTLDHLVAPLSHRPIELLDPAVRAALRLGAYQITKAGTAPHAAVSATVGAVGLRCKSAKGFVNAVLRKLAVAGPPWVLPDGDTIEAIGIRESMPDWLVRRFIDDLGIVDARAALSIANRPAPVTLRTNPVRTTGEALIAELRAAGVEAEPGGLVPGSTVVRRTGDPAALPAVRDGRATPQDQASQAVALAVGARPGERIADVAAAPGGKTTALAEQMSDRGLLVALDVREARMHQLARAVGRLGLTSIRAVVASGEHLPLPPATFDRVLIDAPCSGLGALRRRPEARWRLEATAMATLGDLQRRLMVGGAAAVRPGGTLVYSVCTFAREETLDVDAFVAQHLPELVPLEPLPAPWRPHGRGALLLPHDADTDGMFVVRYRRAPG